MCRFVCVCVCVCVWFELLSPVQLYYYNYLFGSIKSDLSCERTTTCSSAGFGYLKRRPHQNRTTSVTRWPVVWRLRIKTRISATYWLNYNSESCFVFPCSYLISSRQNPGCTGCVVTASKDENCVICWGLERFRHWLPRILATIPQ